MKNILALLIEGIFERVLKKRFFLYINHDVNKFTLYFTIIIVKI